MSNFLVYFPPKDKREHIRFLFQILCKFENIEGDEFDVYSRGGRWFGQIRKRHKIYTEIISEYRIIPKTPITQYGTNEIEIIKIK